MTQYQLTLDSESLQRLFTGDGQLGRLVEAILHHVLNAQVTEQLQAAPYERSDQRQGYRNGYKPRQLTTRVGTLSLLVPQVRDGQFSTEVFARYQRSEQAVVLALMEMVVNGVSTRKVAHITEELCGTSFAKPTVSDLCKALDPLVTAWNERDLRGSRYPFVLVDALVVKVRAGGRVRALSVLVATSVNAQGSREVLGLQVGDSESERTWRAFLTWLKGRGLCGVVLVVGGYALPWLSVTCTANCSYFPWAPTRGPIADYGLASFIICPPVGVLALTFALLTALQEFLPAEGRFAAPSLLLAGLLLVTQAIDFLLLGITLSGRGLPELTLGLLPGVAVAPVGALLVAVGGWLRYHPRRSETSPVLAEAPAER